MVSIYSYIIQFYLLREPRNSYSSSEAISTPSTQILVPKSHFCKGNQSLLEKWLILEWGQGKYKMIL